MLARQSSKLFHERSGLIAIKQGMTAVWDSTGKRLPVTVLQIDRAQVTAHKTHSTEGYYAVQVGSGARNSANVTRPMLGHFSKAKVAPKSYVREFRVQGPEGLIPIGRCINASVFTEGEYVDVKAKAKGKGFQGVMKRHGFHGLRASHGVSISHRSGGSYGQCQDPGRVHPGKKMPGRMGGKQVTTHNCQVVKIDTNLNIILVKGAVPGPKGGEVMVVDAIKKEVARRHKTMNW
ncbi:54S ribosomal protein L9, mitochondrial [Neolecta irregularis DAH-3]|uniref:Large ribosomal subunit protein uL3m n=1 Tax=Neolecta irregularis (strain DAH-3) TaxID=1198029 RepID=A0A1U7LJS1_NEOID|nr:54S ribosomal protein L9, mitochondrial [Neolecta irregularis DAH-3]|eukprot:OLL22894.1 54S ribosomal protein L9, mitochondrial [Neolecta irregularis DAH-3]